MGNMPDPSHLGQRQRHHPSNPVGERPEITRVPAVGLSAVGGEAPGDREVVRGRWPRSGCCVGV